VTSTISASDARAAEVALGRTGNRLGRRRHVVDRVRRLLARLENRLGQLALVNRPLGRFADVLFHQHRLASDADAHFADFDDDLPHLLGEAVVAFGQIAQFIVRLHGEIAREIGVASRNFIEDFAYRADRANDQVTKVKNLADVPGEGEKGQNQHQGQSL
jgi:ABC-type transporter Mla subunit MlaD